MDTSKYCRIVIDISEHRAHMAPYGYNLFDLEQEINKLHYDVKKKEKKDGNWSNSTESVETEQNLIAIPTPSEDKKKTNPSSSLNIL